MLAVGRLCPLGQPSKGLEQQLNTFEQFTSDLQIVDFILVCIFNDNFLFSLFFVFNNDLINFNILRIAEFFYPCLIFVFILI